MHMVAGLLFQVLSHAVNAATAVDGTAPHSTAQHSTAQHSTAQHSTAQHSTAQHSTAQHSTAQFSMHKPKLANILCSVLLVCSQCRTARLTNCVSSSDMPEAVRLRLASFRNRCSSSPVHSFLGLLAKTAWVWMILFLISCLPRVTSRFSLRPCFAMPSPNVATFKQLSSLRQLLSLVGKKLVPCIQQCSSEDSEQEHLPEAGVGELAVVLDSTVCSRSQCEQLIVKCSIQLVKQGLYCSYSSKKVHTGWS